MTLWPLLIRHVLLQPTVTALRDFRSGTPCDICLKVSQDYPLYNKFFQKLRFCLGKMESAPEDTDFFLKLALLRAWKRVTPTAVVDKGISSSYI
jgi:hypothetical protein